MLSYIDHVTECTKWRHTRPLPGEGGGKSKEHRTGGGGGRLGLGLAKGRGWLPLFSGPSVGKVCLSQQLVRLAAH